MSECVSEFVVRGVYGTWGGIPRRVMGSAWNTKSTSEILIQATTVSNIHFFQQM